MADWNSELYLKFEQERTRPARDLADRIRMVPAKTVLDVGCGPGNSTAVLKEAFPGADILGVDNSAAMLDKARSAHPDLRFAFCDAARIRECAGGRFDVIFSNACIQWLPDHRPLLRNMFDCLNPGGVLAVQIPMNSGAPLFRIIREEIARFRELDPVRCEPNETLDPDGYYRILAELTDSFELWECSYYHRMGSHRMLVEWVKGTRLRPYLNVLNDRSAKELEERILERAGQVYPVQPDGCILFRFRRFFFTAKRLGD